MMLQRLMCETNLLAAAVPISGPLEIAVETCPAAKGGRILAIHGRDDQNVPIAGGRGQGLSQTNFASEERTHQVFTRSGADYDLQIIAGADHKLDHIESAILADRKQSIAQIAAEFFGLVGFSTSAVAQNSTSAPAQNQSGACMADYEKYCSGVSPGGGRIIECLSKQHDSLSEACKTKLDARTRQ